jgi:hypothetical protein
MKKKREGGREMQTDKHNIHKRVHTHIYIQRERERRRRRRYFHTSIYTHKRCRGLTEGCVMQNEGLLGNDTPGVGSTNSASFGISDHGYSRLQHNV